MTRELGVLIHRFIELGRPVGVVSLLFCRSIVTRSMENPSNDDDSPFDDLFAPVEKIFAEFDRFFLGYPSLFTVPPDDCQDQPSRSSTNLRDEVLKQDQAGKQTDAVNEEAHVDEQSAF